MRKIFFFAVLFVAVVVADELEDGLSEPEDEPIAKAIIQIPKGKKFKSIETFIKKEMPFYHAVEHERKDDLDEPLLKMYDTDGKEVEVYDISDWDNEELDEILDDYGFFKKEAIDDEVPEEYASGTHIRDEL